MKKKKKVLVFILLLLVCLFNLDIFAAWFNFTKDDNILNISMDIPEKEEEKEEPLRLASVVPNVNLIEIVNKPAAAGPGREDPPAPVKEEKLDKPVVAKQERKVEATAPKSAKALDQKKQEVLNKIRNHESGEEKAAAGSPTTEVNIPARKSYSVQSNVIQTTFQTDFKPITVNIFSEPLPEDDPGYKVSSGINKGTVIKGHLDVGVVSSSTFCPAIVTVIEDVYYDNKVYIPEGSVFYGEAITDYSVRLVFINLNTLIIGDREVTVKAHLFQNNGGAGFCSEIIDLSRKGMWQSFILGVSSGLMGHTKDINVVYDAYGNARVLEANTAKNTVIDGVQQGTVTLADRLMADAARYNIIISVHPMKVNILVDEKIPINRLAGK